MEKATYASSHLTYTNALAAQLIRYLGFDGAEKTCCENHWDGVLQAVRTQRLGNGETKV